MACDKVDHQEILSLVQEIDNTDNKLRKDEINFVADLIDSNVVNFTPEQAKRVRSLHQRRVLEGKPDLD